MSGVKRYMHISQLCEAAPLLMANYPMATEYVLASDYDRDTTQLRKEKSLAIAGMLENHNAFVKEFEAATEALLVERDELRVQVEAMRLLLQQCDKDITEDGGVYIELRAFLFGTLPAEDVIALLGEQPVSQAKP